MVSSFYGSTNMFFHAGAGADTDTDCYKLRGPRTDICAVELFLSTKVVVLH